MNSFIENVNYVANLDNRYGSSIEIYKNNLSLRTELHDIVFTLEYYNFTDKKLHTLEYSYNDISIDNFNSTLLNIKSQVELTGLFDCVISFSYVDFIINNIASINIKVTSKSEDIKTYGLNINITKDLTELYNINGILNDTLKILPSIALLNNEIISDINYISENIEYIRDAAENATIAIAQANIATAKANESSISASNASASELISINKANIATTKASEALSSASEALASKNAAKISETNASTSEVNSLNSANNADISEANALASANSSNVNASIATTKASEASTSAANALSSETSALDSKNSATSSAATATTKAGDALDSSNIATAQASIATTKASEASVSASSALSSKNAAALSASSALTSANNADTSEANALASETSAANSASIATAKASEIISSAINASNSASDALASKNSASASASVASTKATEASSSAALSVTKASEASTSASNALSSANNATTKANDAGTSATNANNSAISASSSANAASISEINSSNSEDVAVAKAGEALTSANNASASEASALASENSANESKNTAIAQGTIATIKANEASISASSALNSENKAHKWATELEDITVEPGEYSAMHWALKAQAYSEGDSANIVYYGTTSGLASTNVQDAIDEIDENIDTLTANVYTKQEVRESLPSVGLSVSAGISVTTGQIAWNTEEGTADLGLSNGSVLQIGQENIRTIRNSTASTIANGVLCMFDGTIGNSGRIKVKPFTAGFNEAMYLYGVATQNITSGSDGIITIDGKVRGVDTTGSSVGEVWHDEDILYAKPNDNGRMTNVIPADNELKLVVATVIHAHSNGTLEIRFTPFNENMYYTKVQNDILLNNKVPLNSDFILDLGEI